MQPMHPSCAPSLIVLANPACLIEIVTWALYILILNFKRIFLFAKERNSLVYMKIAQMRKAFSSDSLILKSFEKLSF